jgi:vancomycin permeability regulator SanA
MSKLKSLVKFLFHAVIYTAMVVFLITGILRVGMLVYSNTKTYLPTEAPKAQVALVLGAGLNRDGSPGVVLQDRVRKASELYFDGKVRKLLMSGDNTSEYYNEPGAMQDFALSLGIPQKDIVLDYAGRRTYDSCFRAKAIFGVDQLIVVTQAYHLPRAIFLCNAFNIEAAGVPADDSDYRLRSYTFWWVREILASLNAYWDVWIAHPQPVLGNPEPIFP